MTIINLITLIVYALILLSKIEFFFLNLDSDFKPLWHQIKEDIDQYYQTSDNDLSLLSVINFNSIKNKIFMIFMLRLNQKFFNLNQFVMFYYFILKK